MFVSPYLSLQDLLGKKYLQAVVSARSSVSGLSVKEGAELAAKKVDFFPEETQNKNDALLNRVGQCISAPFLNAVDGAGTTAFHNATHKNMAPLTGFGTYRIGEDGKLYLLGKSEHYHASLGHQFAGYRLIDYARLLGILNATHNNTRGYITRLLEIRLIQTVNGIPWEDEEETQKVLTSGRPSVLNRVINLETGSLAVEAGVKMMLSRFYRLDPSFPEPKCYGKTPVFFVMADQNGGKEGNYHGTNIFTQTFRGLWNEFYKTAEQNNLYKVVAVKQNDIDDFRKKMEFYNTGKYKTAGFLHEIIMMNYGAVRLEPEFLQQAYASCKQFDTPTLVDEIQSCMWYPGMLLFRLYHLQPDFVVVGKGFPGGEYAASKIITTAEMDTLNQFGALVTNGQEELASLAYLITMSFMRVNGEAVELCGRKFQSALQDVQRRHPETICRVEGLGHLMALHFHSVEQAASFAARLNERCIDSSAQLYKANCPPAVLLKPPVIASEKVLEYLADAVENLL